MSSNNDSHYYDPDDLSEESSQDDSPASVVFMEMMRQAANRHIEENPILRQPDYARYELQGDDINAQMIAERSQSEAALEIQRQKRAARRKIRRRQRIVAMIGGVFRTLIVVIISGGLIATILSWWTSPDSLDDQLRANLQIVNSTHIPSTFPTLASTPPWMRRIGIVSGHRGPENDPGAVCPDGLTEAEITFAVAEKVVILLRGEGYFVDLLEEFDDQLPNYDADVFISIHANDCSDYGEFVSGYLVSHAESRPEGSQDSQLRECLATHYGSSTGLGRHLGLTPEMLDYHAFRKIRITTPGVIFELGFMRADRELLTTQQDKMAQGLFNGVLCFLNGDQTLPMIIPTPTQFPTPE